MVCEFCSRITQRQYESFQMTLSSRVYEHPYRRDSSALDSTPRLSQSILCEVCAVKREEDREAKDFSRLKSG
jgi:hypothetical protein